MGYTKRIVFIPFSDEEAPNGDHVIMPGGLSYKQDWMLARPGRFVFVHWDQSKSYEHRVFWQLSRNKTWTASIYIWGHGELDGYEISSCDRDTGRSVFSIDGPTLIDRLKDVGMSPRRSEGAGLIFKLFVCSGGVGVTSVSLAQLFSVQLTQHGFRESIVCGYTGDVIGSYALTSVNDPMYGRVKRSLEKQGITGKMIVDSDARARGDLDNALSRARDNRVFYKGGQRYFPKRKRL